MDPTNSRDGVQVDAASSLADSFEALMSPVSNSKAAVPDPSAIHSSAVSMRTACKSNAAAAQCSERLIGDVRGTSPSFGDPKHF